MSEETYRVGVEVDVEVDDSGLSQMQGGGIGQWLADLFGKPEPIKIILPEVMVEAETVTVEAPEIEITMPDSYTSPYKDATSEVDAMYWEWLERHPIPETDDFEKWKNDYKNRLLGAAFPNETVSNREMDPYTMSRIYQQWHSGEWDTEAIMERILPLSEIQRQVEEERQAAVDAAESLGLDALMAYSKQFEKVADIQETFRIRRERYELTHQQNLARLTAKGNQDLIDAENERYRLQMEGLENSEEKQLSTQNRYLGQMVLRHFETWAEIRGVSADEAMEMRLAIAEHYGLIDEDSKTFLQMQVEGWETWFSTTDLSAEQAVARYEDLQAKIARYKQSLLDLPEQIDIRIQQIIEEIHRESPGANVPGLGPETEAGESSGSTWTWGPTGGGSNNPPSIPPASQGGGPQMSFASGTTWSPGGPAWLGEAGVELITSPQVRTLAAGSRVYDPSETQAVLRGILSMVTNGAGHQVGRVTSNSASLTGAQTQIIVEQLILPDAQRESVLEELGRL